MARVKFTTKSGGARKRLREEPPTDGRNESDTNVSTPVTSRRRTRSTTAGNENVIEINTDDTRKTRTPATENSESTDPSMEDNGTDDANSTESQDIERVGEDLSNTEEQDNESDDEDFSDTQDQDNISENEDSKNTEDQDNESSEKEDNDTQTKVPPLVVAKSQWPSYLRINSYSKLESIELLKNRFSKQKHILERVKCGCFKHMIDLPLSHFHWQLMKELIKRLVKGGSDSELWFNIGGKVLKFGLQDFAIITGLRCDPCNDIEVGGSDGGHLKKKFFRSNTKLNIRLFNSIFLNPLKASDDELVQLANLYLLENVVYAKQEATQVDLDAMAMVTNEAEFNNFAWGTKSFEYTIKSIRNVVKNMGSCTSNVGGFPQALLIWAYETIPMLSTMGFATRCGHNMPRMLNWIGKKQTRKQSLDDVLDNDTIAVQEMRVDTSAQMDKNKGKRAVNFDEDNIIDDEDGMTQNQSSFRDRGVMMIDIYEMLKYTCKTLSLVKARLGIEDSGEIPDCVFRSDIFAFEKHQGIRQQQNKETHVGETSNAMSGQNEGTLPDEDANELQTDEQDIGGKTHLDGEQMEDVAEPHGTTPDPVAKEHCGASDIRHNEQETLATMLKRKREAAAAAAYKSDIAIQEQQTIPHIEEPIAPIKIVSFAKPAKNGNKKVGGRANVVDAGPTQAPNREKRITRRSATIREPFTTQFGSADKDTDKD